MRLYAIAGLRPGLLRRLALVLGIARAPRATPELRALLTEHARFFLEAGGRVSLEDWQGIDAIERAALAAAGHLLAVKQAVRIGTACQGDLAALRVQAEIDGGRAHDDAQLATAVRVVAREVRRGG